MSKRALIIFAEGFEEIEAVTPLDLLKRAGVDAAAVSLTEALTVTGSHGIKLSSDVSLSEALKTHFDALVLPGGLPGSKNLAESAELDSALRKAASEGKLIAAICAAPALVLAPKGLLKQKSFTCYPGLEKDIKDGKWLPQKTVVDGNLITSRGAGTALDFAFALIENLVNKETADKLRTAVVAS